MQARAYDVSFRSQNSQINSSGSYGDLEAALDRLAILSNTSSFRHRAGAETFRLLGVRIDNVSMTEAIASIVEAAQGRVESSFAFVNADCLNIAHNNSVYADILTRQRGVFADGSGIALACKLRGIAVRENVNGTDMFPLLCEAASKAKLSIFLLGAAPGIAGQVAVNMSEEFPELAIAGTQHGFFDTKEEDKIIRMINQSGADILLVAMGAPRQETWIAANRQRLAPRVAIGVGGVFDFFSGRVWRAPATMRRTGMEWIWRLAQEPKRMWRRYILGNPLFLKRCLVEQFLAALSEPVTLQTIAGPQS